ncbi:MULTISPECIES: single-stranded DNA-binding protein [unclassified Mucilaginibacter]|uniref:single-stranded DNA-binding protein n=1 Tax=unclassified Mucilaginibacter TaxID=2617802 RepID=UPI0031F64887
MVGINKVILVGHLGQDPFIRQLDGGISVASFPLATSENHQKGVETEWHNIIMWRGLADVAARLLQQGKLVYIEGKLRKRDFIDSYGNKKQTTEVLAESFTILGRTTDFEAA